VAAAVAATLPGADAFAGTPAFMKLRAPTANVARAEAARGGIRGAVALDNGEVKPHQYTAATVRGVCRDLDPRGAYPLSCCRPPLAFRGGFLREGGFRAGSQADGCRDG